MSRHGQRKTFSDFNFFDKVSLHLLRNIVRKLPLPGGEKEPFPVKGGNISTYSGVPS